VFVTSNTAVFVTSMVVDIAYLPAEKSS